VYEAKKEANSNGKFEVINVETQAIKAEKETLEDAERFARVLNEMAKEGEHDVTD
jgi:hypothetical protein